MNANERELRQNAEYIFTMKDLKAMKEYIFNHEKHERHENFFNPACRIKENAFSSFKTGFNCE